MVRRKATTEGAPGLCVLGPSGTKKIAFNLQKRAFRRCDGRDVAGRTEGDTTGPNGRHHRCDGREIPSARGRRRQRRRDGSEIPLARPKGDNVGDEGPDCCRSISSCPRSPYKQRLLLVMLQQWQHYFYPPRS
jgi:hypothetical protein